MKKFILILSLVASISLLAACANNAKTTSSSTSVSSTTDKEEDIDSVEEYFDALVTKIEKVTTDNYNSEDYLIYDYKKILREPMEFFSLKMYVYNLEILQVTEEGKYTQILANQPNGDIYMLFLETRRMETKFLENDILHVNGRYLLDYDYTTVNGSNKNVPLIYIDGYNLQD